MNQRFTVKFFKRVITFTVLGIIAALSVTVICFGVQISRLNAKLSTSAIYAASDQEGAEKQNQSFDYQSKYPELYVERSKTTAAKEKKVVYLTFDDGPSPGYTKRVLDILKKYDVKATFFIVRSNTPGTEKLIQRMIDEGHVIGIHSYTHDYKKIYASVDNYLEDFNKLWTYLRKDFNYEAKIFRFPGGSINTYNLSTYHKIIPEMYRRGFTFFDWNTSAEDATIEKLTKEEIINDVINQVHCNDESIVLMHDSAEKKTTVSALPEIIKKLKREGYTFKVLDESVRPVTFCN